jgi:hypothetical protein
MPSNPTVRDVHVNRPLTNIAIAFMQNPENFFSNRIFPMLPVNNKSDEYYVWDRGDWNRDDAQQVGAGDEYPVGVKRLSTDNYNCKTVKYSEMIADEERANADGALDLERTATENVMRKHMIRMDRRWVENYFTPLNVWTGGTTGADITPAAADKWDQFATSDPLAQMRPEIRSLMTKGLDKRFIKLVIGPNVYDALRDHPVFIDRVSNDTTRDPDAAFIAQILGIGEVIVGESVYNAAAEGQTPDDRFILEDDNALLVYATPRPALNVPTGGYTFVWSGLTGSQNRGVNIRKIRRDPRDSDQILSRSSWDNKLVAAECGMLFRDVLT